MSPSLPIQGDHAAMFAAIAHDWALCTLVGIEGSFSRRVGAQIALHPEGLAVGSLADGCLERQLATDSARIKSKGGGASLFRYGTGSPYIDFRLPCGGGVDILVDTNPNRSELMAAKAALKARLPARIHLPIVRGSNQFNITVRDYMPKLRILLFGQGPEFESLVRLAGAASIDIEPYPCTDRALAGISIGQSEFPFRVDPWTAIILLFHDHEWERNLLRWAVTTRAFYIGAQGGRKTRERRCATLQTSGLDEPSIARVRGPIGLIPSARDADVLALSVLSEVVGEHEALHPHQ